MKAEEIAVGYGVGLMMCTAIVVIAACVAPVKKGDGRWMVIGTLLWPAALPALFAAFLYSFIREKW